ncbi:erythromycin esterase family protein [Kribbella turkmenica]|uniref:erythromycin esterase family protein n=1 Tax=Kribbella turkmenica TaxID=2530375 RepID=UPI002D798251|nr:erythromycin esterase family protein [Kribbella turkmenica]
MGSPQDGARRPAPTSTPSTRYRDYLVDLRTLPKQTRDWLNVARPTRDIGTAYPWPDLPVKLGAAYDVLIHLHRVTAAHLR